MSSFLQQEKNEGSGAAVEGVMREAGEQRQANIVAQLKRAGMSDQDIAANYRGGATGEPFLYGAAEAEAKVRVPPGLERKRDADTLTTWMSARTKAKYDPADEEPNPNWSKAQEAIYNQMFDQYNEKYGKKDNRAGVQGFPGAINQMPMYGPMTPPAAPSPVPSATPTAARPPGPVQSSAWQMGGPAPVAKPTTTPVAKPAVAPTVGLKIAVNPKTGQRLVYRNGQWGPQ